MTVGERAAYHSIQCDQVFARATIAKNPLITRVVVEKPALSLPPLKNIGGLGANLGDSNPPPSFQPLFTHRSNSAIGSPQAHIR